jgi:apolipoprotein N-acyltransferase
MHLSALRLFAFGWLAGLAFFVPAIQWMRVADPRMYYTWVALSIYCSLYVPAGLLLTRRLDRRTRLPLVLTVPLVWTGLEYVRAHALTGFAWYFLGHTQHDFLLMIQVADLAGAYAVTFLVAAVNALVFEWLVCYGRMRARLKELNREPTPARLVVPTLAVAALLVSALGYGAFQLSQEDFLVGPRLALIQGNLDQRIRNAASANEASEAATTVLCHYRDLNDQAAALRPMPDLLVWPETSFPEDWVETAAGAPTQSSIDFSRAVARRWPTYSLLGLNSWVGEEEGRKKRYNSALLVTPEGQISARYDKIHRVPFGEFVPFLEWFPWMNQFAPYDYDYSIQPGDRCTRMRLGNYHFGVLICYEDTDPCLARQYARSEASDPAADFLLNISNDGWFIGTSEHEEHLAICRFRAIESRRAVARAVNMGVSAIIDGSGRVLQPKRVAAHPAVNESPVWEVNWDKNGMHELVPSEWQQLKKTTAVLVGNVPIDHRVSLYARWGDWLPVICWLILALGLGLSFWRRSVSQMPLSSLS